MPPGIKCRTCKIAMQSLFIKPVEDGDPDSATINYTRIGVVIGLIALFVIFF